MRARDGIALITMAAISASIATLLSAQYRYDRSAWRHWTGQCQENVRQQVLVAESRREVSLASGGCVVLAGEWLDPYTGEIVTSAQALDIDHMIPLGFAYEHGGFAWDAPRRQAYANDLSDPDHLVAVLARVNRQKSDRGPDMWKPARQESWCWYGLAWDRIARRWHLMLHAEEWDAIIEMTASCEANAR